jgi:hypothetical protein
MDGLHGIRKPLTAGVDSDGDILVLDGDSGQVDWFAAPWSGFGQGNKSTEITNEEASSLVGNGMVETTIDFDEQHSSDSAEKLQHLLQLKMSKGIINLFQTDRLG